MASGRSPTCAAGRRYACGALSGAKRTAVACGTSSNAANLRAQVLQNEQDLSTKRNAFQFLCNHAEERAVNYLLGQIDNVALWGDILQMAVLDLIRKVHSPRGRGQPWIPRPKSV